MPATPRAATPHRAKPYSPATTVPNLIDDAIGTLGSIVRSRGLRVETVHESRTEVRHYAALRRAFIVMLADTLETTRAGGVVTVRTRDLAGGRVEVIVEDISAAPTVVERALAPPDRSGRSTSLLVAQHDLEREHAARLYGESEEGRRRLLLDLGFPPES